MAKSKLQAELAKATKVDDEYENRQDFLKAIIEKVNTFKDPQWDKLTEEAQEWCNAAIKAVKGKKRVPDFPDVGSVPKDEDEDEEKPAKKKKADADEDEDEDEDEKPKKKKKAEEDDESEDEDEKPKKKKKPAEDEDEDEKPKKKKKAEEDDDESEDDEKPKKKKRAEEDEDEDEKPAKKKKPADDDEDEDEKPKKKRAKSDDDDEDEKPKKKKDSTPPKASGVKVSIKTAIIEDPDISVESLVKKLGKGGAEVSKVTVSNVRAEFRHSLKVLKELGKLKGIEL